MQLYKPYLWWQAVDCSWLIGTNSCIKYTQLSSNYQTTGVPTNRIKTSKLAFVIFIFAKYRGLITAGWLQLVWWFYHSSLTKICLALFQHCMYNINMKTPSLSKNQHSVTHYYMLKEKCKVAKLPLTKLWATVVKSALIKSKCIFSLNTLPTSLLLTK